MSSNNITGAPTSKGPVRLLTEWLDARAIRKRDEQHKRGFGYAMVEHYLNEKCVEELEMEIDAAKKLGLFNAFDLGMWAAIDVIKTGRAE